MRAFVVGSPPHMRGKAQMAGSTSTKRGITPAHAGKSAAHCFRRQVDRDHPRTCGEKGCMVFSSRNHSGSPPHMRGKDAQNTTGAGGSGITPAHAGKRNHTKTKNRLHRDHPRTCGEKLRLRLFRLLCSGSPPHMRGKDFFIENCLLSDGITPAHAGKRYFFCLFSR